MVPVYNILYGATCAFSHRGRGGRRTVPFVLQERLSSVHIVDIPL